MLKRKESNVYNDLTFLEGIGLLELEEGKAHARKAPAVDYDALHITVPLSAQVADRSESGSSGAGA
jgi:predicted transcriptional regulator